MSGEPKRVLDERALQLIRDSHVFFVATAPEDPAAHINLSPKGLDSFRVINPSCFAYLDYTASGVETIAHLRENGRITVMFNSFEGNPLILRMYGRGSPLFPNDPAFNDTLRHFEGCSTVGIRSIIVVNITQVTTSCGFGVPIMRFEGYRSQLPDWEARKGEQKLLEYQATHNTRSIDGIEGIPDDVLQALKKRP